MGNSIAIESQVEGGSQEEARYWHGCWNESCGPSQGDALPSILRDNAKKPPEEPVTTKSTERGEAPITLSVGATKNYETGRECNVVNTSVGSGILRYAVSEMQGWRSHMEDRHVINPDLSSNRQQKQLLKDHHLFAVFDGHGGDFASHFCGEHFVPTLIARNEWRAYLNLSRDGSTKSRAARESVTGLKLLRSALTATFLAIDAKLMTAQRQCRVSQLSELEDFVFSLAGNVECDIFQPGTDDHKLIINFSSDLPSSMPVKIPFERSGSTGVVVLITPSHILCANAGDSRAILTKKTESAALPLSFDHNPNNDVELCRVEKDGGIVDTSRIDGGLAVSRGFGDFKYKNCAADESYSDLSDGASNAGHSSLAKNHRVTVHPDIIVYTRESNKDEFIVLACDGIWDGLTNQDCAELVRTLMYVEGEIDAGLICEEVIDTALKLGSRDNMTCCIVVFPGAKMNQCGASNKTTGVSKRRFDRERQSGNNSMPAKRALQRLEEPRKDQQLGHHDVQQEHIKGKKQNASRKTPTATRKNRKQHDASPKSMDTQ